jgi:DNA repair protein RadC
LVALGPTACDSIRAGGYLPVQAELPFRWDDEPPATHLLPAGEYPQDRLNRYGPQALALWELLSIVIGSGGGTGAAIELGQSLTETYESLQQLYVAGVLELARTPGMTEARAIRIQAALELGRRMMAMTHEPRCRVNTPGDAAELLMPDMMLLEQEHMRLILLNSRHEVISTPTVYKGSLNTAVVRVAEVFKDALRQNAAAIVVSHNHPSGDPSPSPEDIIVTRNCVEAGKLLGIEVVDHVIIGHNRYVSLKERGLGFD